MQSIGEASERTQRRCSGGKRTHGAEVARTDTPEAELEASSVAVATTAIRVELLSEKIPSSENERAELGAGEAIEAAGDLGEDTVQ